MAERRGGGDVTKHINADFSFAFWPEPSALTGSQ